MKRIIISGLLLSATFFVFGQNGIINEAEVERIEKFLSSDDMKGRRTFSPEIDKAADFIANEFKATGLDSWNNSDSYLQSFVMIQPKFISADGSMDGETVETKNIIVVTSFPELIISEKSGYEKVKIGEGANLFTEARKLVNAKKNIIALVGNTHASNFGRLTGLKRSIFKSDNSVVFVLTDKDPATYSFTAKHEITEQKLANVVGILPGKSRKDEYVIFSGHYDHVGIGRPVNGDSIYNGANDDAAGTTAMILLAKFFKSLGNNERTLVFAAFTAEEVGGYGSQYFSRQFEPEKVVAMFNIEMIGTESKWGKNSAFITGYEKTDMGKILQKNLEGSNFTFHPDPYPDQQLFYRSDNATLARLGVPAHTISTAKMENEPHYHKPSDEIGTLDLKNMTEIIKAIAVSSRSIVAGKDTPSRVKVEELR
ncbi:MAG: M20/M25/M40 family metallo-hydrolase [Bacteroidia bacterium]|nr:M20/M25/M40 family metallo-hydrolase [Bacteroidia bacterium]